MFDEERITDVLIILVKFQTKEGAGNTAESMLINQDVLVVLPTSYGKN